MVLFCLFFGPVTLVFIIAFFTFVPLPFGTDAVWVVGAIYYCCV